VWPLGPVQNIDVNDWAAAIGINVTGAFILTQALVGAMLDRGWGRIVNVSSGTVGRAGGMIHGNAYSTSKAALEALTLNLAAELEGTGVTVNVYRPGAVDTSMQDYIRNQSADEIGSELHARFTKLHNDGALITPGRSAEVLLRRLSSAASGEVWTGNDAD
jgi:3-oxoacyl-[acyl-carrier protein] reductase